MENASKALLIAGGVLLAMMIITIGIVLYNSFSNTTSQYAQSMSATELTEFNTKFEVFRERTNITAQEIVSLVNMTKENNEYFNVNIEVIDSSNPDDIDSNKNIKEDKIIPFLQNNSKSEFSCIQIGYDTNGQVNLITFKKTAEKSNITELELENFLNKKPIMNVIIDGYTYNVTEGYTWKQIIERGEIKALTGSKFLPPECPCCGSTTISTSKIHWILTIKDGNMYLEPSVLNRYPCDCSEDDIINNWHFKHLFKGYDLKSSESTSVNENDIPNRRSTLLFR